MTDVVHANRGAIDAELVTESTRPAGTAGRHDNGDGVPLVAVRNLTKRFPVRRGWAELVRHPFRREKTSSLREISLDVHAGEFFGLLGPNGAGKTTLLKILATFVTPDEGWATIDGHDVVSDPEAVRPLVAPVIASERSLYWRLTARENLELFAALWNVPCAEVGARSAEVLDVVGLGDTGRKMVGQFSSGMMQRLLIARALLTRPRVLLLDEPTRSLDPVSAREFRRFLRTELADRRRCAVVLATHSADEALDLCDRVGVLHRGELLAVGAAIELARSVAGDRLLVWTTAPGHRALDAYRSRDTNDAPGSREAEDGWTPVVVEVAGGASGAAELLRSLIESGVPVARFERLPVSLASLLERVVASREQR